MSTNKQFQRHLAERLAQDRLRDFQHLDDLGKDELIAELTVHQIELEMQNAELEKSQTRLEFLRREYLALYDAAPIGYASLDDNGLVARCNLTFADMLQRDRSSITGRPLVQFIHPEDHALLLGRYRAFVKQPDNKHIDVRFLLGSASSPNSETFVGRIQGRRIIHQHEADASTQETLLVVISDITQIKHNEQELAHYQSELESLVSARTEQFNAARLDAEKANRAKSEFLANMSHEIRTPMNAVIGMHHLALKSGLAGKPREQIVKAQLAAQSLLGIINDILDFSKIEAQKLELESTQFELLKIIAELEQMFSLGANNKLIEFNVQLDPALPAQVCGDPLRLRQVLTNLLSNAIKFSHSDDQVTLSITLEKRDGSSANIRFCVKDSGIGMTPAQQASVFAPFQQGDSSITRQFGGTGLGLAISHKLVDLMGGELKVDSAPDAGSEFCFMLSMPICGAEEDGQPGLSMAERAQRAEQQLQGCRVLVVEDNDLNRELAQELLAMSGIHSVIACDGQQAVNFLASQSVDGVLMDCQMPVMDGYTATREIRQTLGLTQLPIIAMTANAMREDRQKALAAGMNDHISKPIDPDQMLIAMARWIRRSADAAI